MALSVAAEGLVVGPGVGAAVARGVSVGFARGVGVGVACGDGAGTVVGGGVAVPESSHAAAIAIAPHSKVHQAAMRHLEGKPPGERRLCCGSVINADEPCERARCQAGWGSNRSPRVPLDLPLRYRRAKRGTAQSYGTLPWAPKQPRLPRQGEPPLKPPSLWEGLRAGAVENLSPTGYSSTGSSTTRT